MNRFLLFVIAVASAALVFACTGDRKTASGSDVLDSTGEDTEGDSLADTGQEDTGQEDTGQEDTGQPDTGQPDTGQPDTGQPDTGCTPDCNTRQCGDDGCGLGGTCGVCPPTTQCNAQGLCEPIPSECASASDGTPCTAISNGICLSQNCAPSYCGDGFVNTAGGEECDDGNVIPGDGCDPPLCTFGCINAGDCPDDGDDCNGTTSCNTATHVCDTTAPLAVNAPCVINGQTGTCQGFGAAVVCIAAGCGNNILDAGEECDDGNVVDDDGCKQTCEFTCETDAECDDGDACNGDETCIVASHVCNPGTALDCVTNDPCSTDSCDADAGCVHEQIDGDGDGYSPENLTCTAANGFLGGDCDDNRQDVNPGQSEVCNNGINDDCAGGIDDGQSTWWADCDADGVPATGAPSTVTCNYPAIGTGCGGQWVTRSPQTNPDCCDTDGRVYPGASTWRTYSDGQRACGGWDYNCDGSDTRRYNAWYVAGSCSWNGSSGNNGCSLSSSAGGWAEAPIFCGNGPHPWYSNCQGGFPSCSFNSVTTRTQGCR